MPKRKRNRPEPTPARDAQKVPPSSIGHAFLELIWRWPTWLRAFVIGAAAVAITAGALFGLLPDRYKESFITWASSFRPLRVIALHEVSSAAQQQRKVAEEAFLRGDLATAMRAVDRAIDIDQSYGDAHRLRGAILFSLKRHDEAIAEWREAIRLNPRDDRAYYNIGLVLNGRKQWKDAERAYLTSLRIRADVATRNNLGWSRFNMGRFDEARADFKAALEMDPHFVEALVNMGHLELASGHYTEALGWLTSALKHNAADVEALKARAEVYDKLGRHADAERDREAARAAAPREE